MLPESVLKQLKALEACLREYYSQATLPQAPDSIERREFGFTSFDGGFRRHMSFRSAQEFWTYVVRNAPRDAYFSVARYTNPTHEMHAKGWESADLPFDLDAEQVLRTDDPLVKAGWISDQNYELIKREFLKLLEDFLERDFGLSRGDYQLAFSGGRGYHVRVTAKAYADMDQRMRRQIVEYVALGPKPADATFEKKKGRVYPFTHGYGWNRRVFNWLKSMDQSQVNLPAKATVQRIAEAAKRCASPEEFSISQFQTGVFAQLMRKAVDECTVSIDERVTVDVNRLLRAPGTVHGGSGLLCTPLQRSEIERFNPVEQASMKLKTTRRIKVGKLPFKVSVNGEELAPEQAGSAVEVNTGLAYYVVVRRGGLFADEII
ncbi:MAG: DNA primase catalytic subunit PriS [Thermoprotei archaeon]